MAEFTWLRSHNPFETGLTAANVATLERAWATDTGDRATSPPVTSAGGVHVTAGLEVVTLDPATGAERWSYPVPPDRVPLGGIGGEASAACGRRARQPGQMSRHTPRSRRA